jgi:hypothetical protein
MKGKSDFLDKWVWPTAPGARGPGPICSPRGVLMAEVNGIASTTHL